MSCLEQFGVRFRLKRVDPWLLRQMLELLRYFLDSALMFAKAIQLDPKIRHKVEQCEGLEAYCCNPLGD